MNYQQALDYLYTQLPMFTRIGAAALKPDLKNTLALCAILGNPERTFKSIHIAGTNGKGSTSHMLASILQEAGYKTGLYTSPHLKDFRERIRINGEMIPKEVVVGFITKHQAAFDRISPSFFEWCVALCFHYFSTQNVDVAVIETGLGGRLDSTNVIKPVLSVITNIGWDHTDLLGDTLGKIASEKAGIIKQKIPVVIGETQAETKDIFTETALKLQAPIQFADREIQLKNPVFVMDGIHFNSLHQDNNLIEANCSLGGLYQLQNIKTVLLSVLELQKLGFNISDNHIILGLAKVKSNTGLMGRWQTLSQHPTIICDTGHNADGIRYIIQQLLMQTYDSLHMVIGMVKDKDISKILQLLPKKATYYFCNADLPRALPANELREQASQLDLHGNAYTSVQHALEAAKKAASVNDLIFIGGSTFVVAEAI